MTAPDAAEVEYIETYWDRVHRIQRSQNLNVTAAMRVARAEVRLEAKIVERRAREARS